jgi:hypothetical protein
MSPRQPCLMPPQTDSQPSQVVAFVGAQVAPRVHQLPRLVEQLSPLL